VGRGRVSEKALGAWLSAASAAGDRVQAAQAAAEALAGDPWAVVEQAGHLARATIGRAEIDVAWRTREGGAFWFPAGGPIPETDPASHQREGTFDTPRAMAREVVSIALRSSRRPVERALDPTCGCGAMLVALDEAGLGAVSAGAELDPAAAAVAQVAAPRARVRVADCIDEVEEADLIVGNPPFVAPRHQSLDLRRRLRARLPWIEGRCDLALAVAALAAERLRPGGGLGLVLPAGLLFEPYGRPLRARWLGAHALTAVEGPRAFPAAAVRVFLVGLCAGAGPAALPGGIDASELLALPGHPLDPALRAGDAALWARVAAASTPLGSLCWIDTGVVCHGPGGGKARLLTDVAEPGAVPFVDAADLIAGRLRFLRYRPEEMHRAKSPALFAGEKLLVQRILGDGALRCWVDDSGLYAGHTLTVVSPRVGSPRAALLQGLLEDPRTAGLLRLRRGWRVDLYPQDLASLPVPQAWLLGRPLEEDATWGLDAAGGDRLRALARRGPPRG